MQNLLIFHIRLTIIFVKGLQDKYSTLLKMNILALRCFAARAKREIGGETVFFEPKARKKPKLPPVFAAARRKLQNNFSRVKYKISTRNIFFLTYDIASC